VKPTIQPSDITRADWQYAVDQINMYRARLGVPPVALDAGLSLFASDGSNELMTSPPDPTINDPSKAPHTFHTHYERLKNSIPQDSAENQFYFFGGQNTQTLRQQIDAALAAFFAEGPENGDGKEHGHYVNMENPAYSAVGIGLAIDANGNLYLTTDFSAPPR
jgi:hypothetical protein